MQIFLEGSECCFKTTIAKKLQEKLGYFLVKGSSFELATSTNEKMFSYMMTILKNDADVIVDRYIYSNRVYATLFPNYTKLTDEQYELIDNKLNNNNKLVVYLYANNDTIFNRLSVRGDEYIKDFKTVKDINEMYNRIISQSKCNLLSFNTDEYESDRIVELIIEHLAEHL